MSPKYFLTQVALNLVDVGKQLNPRQEERQALQTRYATLLKDLLEFCFVSNVSVEKIESDIFQYQQSKRTHKVTSQETILVKSFCKHLYGKSLESLEIAVE